MKSCQKNGNKNLVNIQKINIITEMASECTHR